MKKGIVKMVPVMETRQIYFNIFVCDVCGKLIGQIYEDQNELPESEKRFSIKGNFYSISMEEYNLNDKTITQCDKVILCSKKCLKKAMNDILKTYTEPKKQSLKLYWEELNYNFSKYSLYPALKDTPYELENIYVINKKDDDHDR